MFKLLRPGEGCILKMAVMVYAYGNDYSTLKVRYESGEFVICWKGTEVFRGHKFEVDTYRYGSWVTLLKHEYKLAKANKKAYESQHVINRFGDVK